MLLLLSILSIIVEVKVKRRVIEKERRKKIERIDCSLEENDLSKTHLILINSFWQANIYFSYFEEIEDLVRFIRIALLLRNENDLCNENHFFAIFRIPLKYTGCEVWLDQQLKLFWWLHRVTCWKCWNSAVTDSVKSIAYN